MSEKDSPTEKTTESVPIFETVQEDTPNVAKNEQEVAPEVISEETPENITQEDIEPEGISDGGSIDIPTSDDSEYEEGNKKKYIFIGFGAIVLIIIFIIVFSFIRKLGERAPEKAELEYWGLWEDEQIFEGVIQDYMKENSHVTIKYVKQDPKRYREKLIAQINDGAGPDIFRYHNTWLPSIISVASPLPKDIMSHDEFNKTFYEVSQKDLMYDENYYGIPLEIDGLLLIYNDELFKKAGINNAPQTWEDLLRAANMLRVQNAEGDILTSGIALGTANNIEHFSDIFGWILLQNGADISKLSSKEAVEALKFYRRFAEPPQNLWNEKMPKDISAFIQGKVAMIIAPSWEILIIKNQNPDLKLKVSKLPVLPSKDSLSLANYWVEGVSKSSKNQKEAWKFLVYLSRKENMEKLYETQKMTRIFGEPYSRVDLRDKILKNEYIGAVAEQAPFMKSLPVVVRTYDNGMNDKIVGYIRDAINKTLEGVDYQEAMNQAEKGVNQVLEEYKIQ